MTQIYGSCSCQGRCLFRYRLTACCCAVASWMQSNRLQLKYDKTEVPWCATTRRHQLPMSPQLVDGTPIDPVQSVRGLGIFIDANLVMQTHVQRTVSRCFAVLSAAFYPKVCANDYVPDSYRLAATIEAGLRKCRFGRSSGLPSSPSSVGDERGSTAHLRSASHRPPLGCTRHPTLAPSPGEGVVQDGRAHVQGLSWSRAAIPESAVSCRRSPWSALPPFCSDQPSAGAVRDTVYRWRPSLPSHRTDHLEQSAGQHDLCSVSFYLPSASETFLF